MGTVVDLEDDTWRDQIAGDRPACIEFWGPWCTSCMLQRPIVDQIASLLGERVGFFRVNVGTTRIDRELGVRTLPTVLVMKDGAEVARVTGDATRNDILVALAGVLES
ncbi:MAG: thioredoxin family protein [Actinomycetaceae bacterium]|nr:thioredoxin family protein [Actinomycetaceae bacterium]MDU0970587.1 thioredoxin family protein [Actinomycetaceae bacterium]